MRTENTTYGEYVIEWQSNDGNLWDDTDGVDVAASESRYYDLVLDAIEERFPGVAIKLQRQNAIGYERGFSAYGPDSDAEGTIVETCRYIAQQVFVNGEWYVEVEA